MICMAKIHKYTDVCIITDKIIYKQKVLQRRYSLNLNEIFMLKYTSYIILSLMTVSLLSCNQQKSNDTNNIKESNSSELNTTKQDSKIALQLHDKLMNHFGKDWIERESDPDLYPEYYGGSFINNNGIFVIAVTDNSEYVKEVLKEALETDNFEVETVRYSYKEMLRVMDKIDNFLVNTSIPSDHIVLANFAGAYPDVMENRVKVLLTDVNQNIIDAFKRDVTNSQLVIFEKGEIPELY